MSTITAFALATTPPATTPPATMHRTRVRLTRRGRIVLTAVGAIPVIVGAALFALNGGAAVASGQGAANSFSSVTVASGESLWQIAETIAPASDPRDVISAIIHLNQLPDAMVFPGQSLAIPVQYAPHGE